MDAIVAKLKKIPPVTRFLCISLVSVSVTKFQVWRLWSSFLLGIRALAFFFEMGILYRTGKRLEQGPYLRKSADLAYQLVIASGAIIAVNILVKGMLFFHPFLCCIIYLSSKLTPPGAQTLRTSLYGLGFIPVKYFPFALLAIDLLNGGPYGAVLSVLGMIISHLWWVGIWGSELGGRSGPLAAYGRAPRWLARWFGEETAPSNTRPGAGRGTNWGSGAHAAPPRNIAAPSNRGPGAGGGGANWGSGVHAVPPQIRAAPSNGGPDTGKKYEEELDELPIKRQKGFKWLVKRLGFKRSHTAALRGQQPLPTSIPLNGHSNAELFHHPQVAMPSGSRQNTGLSRQQPLAASIHLNDYSNAEPFHHPQVAGPSGSRQNTANNIKDNKGKGKELVDRSFSSTLGNTTSRQVEQQSLALAASTKVTFNCGICMEDVMDEDPPPYSMHI